MLRSMERLELDVDVDTLREIDAEAESRGIARHEIVQEILHAWHESATAPPDADGT